MKVSDLRPWNRNPRKITASKKRILQKTLLQFGDLSGIVLNKANGMLLSGHQRSEALANAEIEITKRFDKPTKQGTIAIGYAVIDDERHAYREVLFDEKTHAAAALAANKGAGEWDWAILKDLALELDDGSFDMELTGFELPEIENLVINLPGEDKAVDYSALDGADVDDKIQIMSAGVRKAIQIEFRPEDFERAQKIVKYWRDTGEYLGMMIIEHLERIQKMHQKDDNG